MNKRLIIPKEHRDDISRLVSLSEEQLQNFFDILNLKYTKDDDAAAILAEVVKRLGLSTQITINLLRVIYNISLQKETFNLDDNTLIEELKEVFQNPKSKKPVKEIQYIDQKRELIVKLIGPKPKAEDFEKDKFLQTGLIRTASSFRSFCDIRPHFNKERTKIESLLPIIIMEVAFSQDHEEEVFQLNEESFEKLREFVEKTSVKLRVMNELIKQNSKFLGKRNE